MHPNSHANSMLLLSFALFSGLPAIYSGDIGAAALLFITPTSTSPTKMSPSHRCRLVPPQITSTTLQVHDNKEAGNNDETGDELFLERFRRRRDTLSKSRIQSMQLQRKQLNNQDDDPIKLAVTSILDSLSRPHSPIPYFGYKMLYEGSTSHWQEVLRKSVGASVDTDETFFYTALTASMERRYNQFGILVGVVEDDAFRDNDGVECYYKLEFPRDTLDYYDGTAWVECRLRDVHSDALLAVLGWSMIQQVGDINNNNGSASAWLVDGIDWQDFREKYRPGIGREEWERICG